MKIIHVKTITDGVESDAIHIDEVEQLGYSVPIILGRISLKTAHELLKALDEKLSGIPY